MFANNMQIENEKLNINMALAFSIISKFHKKYFFLIVLEFT